jgi:hypothetical protein
MIIKSFEARVVEGRLQYDASLDNLEGRTVEVTVAAPEDSGSTASDCSRSKVKWVGLIDEGPAKPCIILPDEDAPFLDEI